MATRGRWGNSGIHENTFRPPACVRGHRPCCERRRSADTLHTPAPWRSWCRAAGCRRRNPGSFHLAAHTHKHTHTKHTTWFTSCRRATCNHVCFMYVGSGYIKRLHMSPVLFCLKLFGFWTVFMFKLQTFPAHSVSLSSIKVWNKKIKIQLDRCVYSGLDLNNTDWMDRKT